MGTETHTESGIAMSQVEFVTMVDALEVSSRRFVALLTELDEPDAERPVPGLEWSIGDTAAHMLTILRRGTGDDRRADTLAGLAELNQQSLRELDTRSPAELAELIGVEAGTLVSMLAGLSQDQAAGIEVQLHAGLRADLPSALSYILCDLLAHGHDISLAADRDWSIDPKVAAFDLHAMVPLLGPWLVDAVRSGPPTRVAVTFPGDDVALVLEAGAGNYRARRVARTDADGVTEVDPVESFLAISGRGEPHDPTVRRLASWFQPF